MFARDVREYARLGILGIGTESRGATTTTFFNLFFRGQLMWDPKADVSSMLVGFYPAFYGPAGPAMGADWGRIFAPWNAADTTEHKSPAAPTIYTPQLVAALRGDLSRAEATLATTDGGARDRDAYRQRMRFTRLGFDIIDNYVAVVTAAASDVDYAAAARAGNKALAARLALAQMNPTFTTRVIGSEAENPGSGASSFPGEVEQMRALAALTDGSKGALLAKLPLRWLFRLGDPVPPS